MRRFIIDTDAASDDLVACILALRDPGCVVEAITICAGVLDHETANINGRVAVEIGKADQPPVYTGMTKPLWRAPMTGENAHGKDGLSDVGLSKTTLPFTPGHAVDKISFPFPILVCKTTVYCQCETGYCCATLRIT